MRSHTEYFKKFIKTKISKEELIEGINRDANIDTCVDNPVRVIIYASQNLVKKYYEDKKEVIDENIWLTKNTITELEEQGEFTTAADNDLKKYDRQLGRLSDSYYNYLQLTKDALEMI